MDSVASAFKSTELVYPFLKENFAAALKGFTRGKHGLTKNSSYPFVVNSPAGKLFAGVGIPVLIRISSFFDDQNTFENNHVDCKR